MATAISSMGRPAEVQPGGRVDLVQLVLRHAALGEVAEHASPRLRDATRPR